MCVSTVFFSIRLGSVADRISGLALSILWGGCLRIYRLYIYKQTKIKNKNPTISNNLTTVGNFIDLDRFTVIFQPNIGVSQNISKCKIQQKPIPNSVCSYNIMNSVFVRADSYAIGIKVNNSLEPWYSIDTMRCKALKILGFAMRWIKDFFLNNSVKTSLHLALVKPILDYLGPKYYKNRACERVKKSNANSRGIRILF